MLKGIAWRLKLGSPFGVLPLAGRDREQFLDSRQVHFSEVETTDKARDFLCHAQEEVTNP